MDILAKEAVDPKAALHALPPLIKGYLRLGATFGDGAVIDRQFGTTDVLVILPVSAINAALHRPFRRRRRPPRSLGVTVPRPPRRARRALRGRSGSARRRRARA